MDHSHISFHKYIRFVQFLYVGLDLGQLLLVTLFTGLEAHCVNQSHVGQLLVLVVDLVPFPLEAFADFCDFCFAQAVVLGFVF